MTTFGGSIEGAKLGPVHALQHPARWGTWSGRNHGLRVNMFNALVLMYSGFCGLMPVF
jgi:alcohol dehydrogenase class IV